MSVLEEITPSPRRVMTLFYLIDTSESMGGSKIGTLNASLEEGIILLQDIAKTNDDADIKVAALQFSSGCSWITSENEPVELDQWEWHDLHAEGITDFGAALIELDKKLSRNEFLKSQTGAYAPVIILISDGYPTDNWEKALSIVKSNNWFKHAIKIAIDIAGGSDRDVLEAFTGNREAIVNANNPHVLKQMIHKISVRASEFQSHSKQTSNLNESPEEDSASIVHGVLEEINEENSAVSIDTNDANWVDW